MTNKEAKEIIKSECYVFNPLNLDRSTMVNAALDMAIKALEKESILDKVRAEIEKCYCTVTNDYDHGRNYGLYMATQIIDKYKAETEGDK